MICAGDAAVWKDFAGERAEPPLHPVADNGIADFLGDGEPDPNAGVVIAAVVDEKDESGGSRAPSGVRGQEVRPFLENRKRF